jgi:Tol biopolymer transport system component
MDDLRRRFAALDGVRPPDLWDDIERRAVAVGSPQTVAPRRVPVRGRRSGDRSVITLLAAAALLVALLGGALAVGLGSQIQQVIEPRAPLGLMGPSPTASPAASSAPSPSAPAGLVVYTMAEPLPPEATCRRPIEGRCYSRRTWIANDDGTGARVFRQDAEDGKALLAWSPDGSQLLYQDMFGAMGMTDVAGTASTLIGTYDTLCDPRCTSMEGFTFSPDGTRLAFAAGRSPESGATSVIAILELATGRVSELASTATTNDGMFCDSAADEGSNDPPQWSPDGTRMVFARQVVWPRGANGFCQSVLLTVRADGTDLRVLVPAEHHPLAPEWSPDGSAIVFHTVTYASVDDEEGRVDIFSVRPDGTGLVALTTGGVSSGPRWTRDGRIIFVRWLDPAKLAHELWTMDADGSHAAPIPGKSLADLTAVGCTRCLYPADDLTEAIWQPTP